MRRFMMLVLAGLSVLFAGLAWAQTRLGPRQTFPIMRSAGGTPFGVPKKTESNSNVTPLAIPINSSTPDGTASNSSTTVTFTVTGSPAAFHVYAVAGAANFSGCNTPPASAVTITCGTPVGVTCAAAGPLTNNAAGTTVATGTRNQTVSFKITYTFQDAWNYSVGSTCQNTVTYYYAEP